MRRTTFMMGAATLILLTAGHDSQAQRGGRGGGRGGGGGAARPSGGAAAWAYSGGPGVASRPAAPPVVGPAGGTRTPNSWGGSYTTQRGSTIDYGGAGVRGTTGGGVNYGKGVGGVQVTTPGGREVTKVGSAAAAAGPGGNAVAGRSGATVGSGPRGSFGSAYHGGVAVGPQGGAAAGGRVGTATGPGGTVSGATRGAAAVGPYGAASARGGVAVGRNGGAVAGAGAARGATGTYYRSAAAVTGQGTTVRQNFRSFAQENPLLAARWVGPTWRPITTAALAGFTGYAAYSSAPIYYDYGETVVYEGETVYVNGQAAGTVEQYTEQATAIANVGEAAKADPKTGEWQPLGVFAMVGEGETKSTNIFQLAVNKEGVIRGEYYNALTDEASQVAGSVGKTTQLAAWRVVGKTFPVYEAGLANMTKDETTMIAHYSKDKSQQFALIRLPPPEEIPPEAAK